MQVSLARHNKVDPYSCIRTDVSLHTHLSYQPLEHLCRLSSRNWESKEGKGKILGVMWTVESHASIFVESIVAYVLLHIGTNISTQAVY